MNAFKYALLFLAVILAVNLQQPKSAGKLEKVELVNNGVIKRTGALIVPSLLKWDAPLSNSENDGEITLRVKEMRFVYTHNGTKRNEYKLAKIAPSEIVVKRGDKVEIEFNNSYLGFEDKIDAFVKVGEM